MSGKPSTSNQASATGDEVKELKLKLERAQRKCIALETQKWDQEKAFKYERMGARIEREFWKNPYDKLLKLIGDEFSCYICLKICIDATVLGCGHLVCGFCWTQFKEKAIGKTYPTCPTCRAPAFIHSRHVCLNGYLEKVFEIMPIHIKEKRKLQLQERKRDEDSASHVPAAHVVMQPLGEPGAEYVLMRGNSAPGSPTYSPSSPGWIPGTIRNRPNSPNWIPGSPAYTPASPD